MHGLRRTSLERIAEAAGVSQMTLYRRFGNRDALLGAVIAREARRLIARFDESIAEVLDPEQRFVQGVLTSARLFAGGHLIRRLLGTDPDLVLPLLTTQGEDLHALGRAYVAEQFRRAHDQGMPISADPVLLADVFVRIAQTLLISPNDSPRTRRTNSRTSPATIVAATAGEQVVLLAVVDVVARQGFPTTTSTRKVDHDRDNPARPGPRKDEGYFGPGSITWESTGTRSWRVSAIHGAAYTALSSETSQAVVDHSKQFTDPIGRATETAYWMVASVFGVR